MEGLKTLIDWHSYNAEICGVAFDGPQALELILGARPDIVIIDIRMPGMNGLEVIRRAKPAVPGTAFVIISGYDDFEYARLALRLGVVDYISKPVTLEKMQEVLARIIGVFSLREQPVGAQVPDRVYGDMFRDLLDLPEVTEAEVLAVQQRYAANLLGIRSLIVCSGRLCAPGAQGVLQQRLESELKPLGLHYTCFYYHEQLVIVLFSTTAVSGDGSIPAGLRGMFRTLCDEGSMESTGISSLHSAPVNIRYACQEALRAARYAAFFDEALLAIEEVEYNPTLPGGGESDMGSIEFLMRTGQNDEVLGLVRSYLQRLLAGHVSMDLFCHECLELIYLGLRVCRETGTEYAEDEEKPFLPHDAIRGYSKASELTAWVQDVFLRMCAWMNEHKTAAGRKSVQTAVRYIDTHYGEDITLVMLAEMCDMYPTYFSVLFKQQMDQTYSKYLNTVRMEKAIQLLGQDLRIREIGERVGFHNTRYFYDKFKSYTGLTPEQYRKKHKRKGV